MGPLVKVIKPNNSLRLCFYQKNLNRAINHSIPSADEILAGLSGITWFSLTYIKDGFFQVLLDEESSKLYTFAPCIERYTFLRMPFGIS